MPHSSQERASSAHDRHRRDRRSQTQGSYRATPRPVLSAPPSQTSSSSSSSGGGNAAFSHILECDIGLRPLKGMSGLRMAENGDAMVEFDVSGDSSGIGSRFLEGNRFVLDPMTPGGGAIPRSRRTNTNATTRSDIQQIPPELTAEVSLSSHDTLLNIGRSHSRNAAELKALLGNSNARLKPNAVMLSATCESNPGDRKQRNTQTVSLEQAKPRARVEIDVVLESNTLVQGGYMRGFIKVRVRTRAKKEAPVFLTEGKLRVVGFESIHSEDDTYTFYQSSASFSAITDSSRNLYQTPLGPDGFAQAVEGVHVLPFAMELPADSSFGNAKGVLSLNSGAQVRYVAMVSIKVRDSGTGKRSIAHFYRNCEIWPLLDPAHVLSAAPRPLQASTAKSFSLLSGGDHKVKLTAQLHRLNWIAGQRCHVKILVHNETRKSVKSCTLTLVRTTTLFRPRPALDAGGGSLVSDPDACQTSTSHKAVAINVLEMSQRGAKGYASAKGWWTGVRPGQELEFSHFIQLPTETLSITRSRLLEVEYSIRVTISAGPLTSDVYVTLPIRVVNFLSIDSPPTAALLFTNGAYFRSIQRQASSSSVSDSESSRWDTIGSNATAGVMHFSDEPPPPTNLSDHSLFSEESSTTSSMQSLVPLALRAQNAKLRVVNPDTSRLELTRACSDASVYSTQSQTLASASSSSEPGSRGDGFQMRISPPAELANLPLDSDETSDADEVFRSVLGDLRQDGRGGGPRLQTSTDNDNYDPSATSEESMEQDCLTAFNQRVQEKLASAKLHRILGTSDGQDDDDSTPRIGYMHRRRSDHIQIPSTLQPGPRPKPSGLVDPRHEVPSVPPRSSKRPQVVQSVGIKSSRSPVRGPRIPLRSGVPRPLLQTSEMGSSGSEYAMLAYMSASRSSQLSKDDPKVFVKHRIASQERRIRRNKLTS